MPKTRAQKVELLKKYQEVVDTGSFVVVETDKVPAQVLVNLRKELSNVGAKLLIIKNKVFAKATAKEEALKEAELVGELAVLEGGSDIVTALKQFEVATKQAKAKLALTGAEDPVVAKYIPFTFKLGLLNHTLLQGGDVVRLATMPNKNVLLGQVVGTMAAPISGFMHVLSGVPRSVVYAFAALKDKKAAEGAQS